MFGMYVYFVCINIILGPKNKINPKAFLDIQIYFYLKRYNVHRNVNKKVLFKTSV